MRFMALFVSMVACTGTEDSADVVPALDLTERLGADRSRAGQVVVPLSLVGGVSADGRVGDYKIYNDRAQFIIQGMRDGHYYVRYGGAVIDADVVREEGATGRDIIDDMAVMAGLGRMCEPDSIDVVDDGSSGGAAVIRVICHSAPMELVTGTLESMDVIPHREVRFVTDYILEPASPLLQIETTLEWLDDDPMSIQPGDLLVVSEDVTDKYYSGGGLVTDNGTGEWFGLVGRENQVALALMRDEAPWPFGVISELLSEIGPMLAGLGSSVYMEPGSTFSMSRYLGVGPDLATLTDAWYDVRQVPTESLSGVVTAGSEPVAGARVHVMDESGSILSMAHTLADGSWSVDVPVDTVARIQATGRGHAEHDGLPDGAGWSSAYAVDALREMTLSSFTEGAVGVPFAEGYGVSEVVSADDPISLVEPAILAVDVGDGRPAVVRIDFLEGDSVSANSATTIGRPGGSMARAYPADGEIEIPVEPGDYRVVVHRGATWEPWSFDVSVVSGQRTELVPVLEEVIEIDGVLRMDPHSHGAPSGDGRLSMEHRLLVHAANGIQVHFGTDHDHVADYRPLLEPLEISRFMNSVLSNEVSPTLRGHHNVYPLEAVPELPNHGSTPWQQNLWSTEELHQNLRDRMDGGGIIQINHGMSSSGMFNVARVSAGSGVVGVPDHWSPNFDAMEVINDGDWSETTEVYLDLVSRGLQPTPVGVSDAHGYQAGEDFTYVYVGHDDPAELTDSELVTAFLNRATVASTGPYIEATIDEQWASGTTVEGAVDLDVVVYAPSWMQIDGVDLLENGQVIENLAVAEGSEEALVRISTRFELNPENDAHYVVMVRGSQSMAPVYPGRTAWAMTAALLVDIDGDGWDPPLPSLVVD